MKTGSKTTQNLNIRSNLQIGYYNHDKSEPGEYLTDAEACNNKCMQERDARSWDCGWKSWPKSEYNCAGNNNGMMLDQCMATCWPLTDLPTQRNDGGKPYNSGDGDKCFNEFIGRSTDPRYTFAGNQAEWNSCLKTISKTW